MFRELLMTSNTDEYIEGSATGDFSISVNGGVTNGGSRYDIAVSDNSWR